MNDSKMDKVEKEAKQILEKFSKSLGKVDFKEKDLRLKLGGFREEGSGVLGNSDFRERMFENAHSKDGDFIIAERKKW